MPTLQPLPERFWKYVNKAGPISVKRLGPCWLWTGSVSNIGYGRLFVNGHLGYAHRIAYELVIGEIPPGLEIDHLCGTRACVNPFHLDAVTHRENLRRSPNTFQGKHARKTRCLRGHPFDIENTFIRPDGTRKCRKCDVIRWKARRDARVRKAVA